MKHLNLRVILKLLIFLMLVLVLYLPVVVLYLLKERHIRNKIVQGFYAMLCVGWRIDVKLIGKPSNETPLLIMANHSSYADVFVLGGLAPISFTPKSDVQHWPVIGHLCRLSDCFFVDRSIEQAKTMVGMLKDALERGYSLCVFPESTTSDGVTMLPFKSSMFSLAETTGIEKPVHIQPVAISYVAVNNMPVDIAQRPLLAWYGDMDFFPHLCDFLSLGKVSVVVTFLPTVEYKQFGSRKLLAQAVEERIVTAREEAQRLVVKQK